MKKGTVFLINIPSASAFFLALAPKEPASCAIALLIGTTLGIAVYICLKKINHQIRKLHLLIAVLTGALICCMAAHLFYKTWMPSMLMRALVTKVFPDYAQGLCLISISAGLVSFPFTVCSIGIILPHCVRFFVLFNYKALKSELLRGIAGASALKKAGIIAANLLSAALIGVILLTAVYLLPIDQINGNIRVSAYTIKEEGTYPRLSEWCTSMLDNYTDSIIMLESANSAETSPLTAAMNVSRGDLESHDPSEVLTAYYIDGTAFDRIISYPRYWHGYLVLLKPLFMVLDYSMIRVINGIAQFLLVLLVCFLLVSKNYSAAVIPYIISYLMLMPAALAKSFQFSSCFYILSIGCIILLLISEVKLKSKAYLIFLYCGISTAFFDFLTYPMATFGVPMVFYLLLTGNDSVEAKTGSIIRYGFIWCVGYACMWAAKWIIGSIITGNNIITDGMENVAVRTSTSSADGSISYGLAECELINYSAFFTTPITIAAIICNGFLIYRCVKHTRYSSDAVFKYFAPFLITGFLPAIWFAFTANHSTVHAWFTNKACVVSLLSVLFGLVSLLQSDVLQTEGLKSSVQTEQ